MKTFEPVIYALCDPETDEIRYVGFTINKAQRLYSHLSHAKREKSRSPSSQWIRSLLERGLSPKWRDIEQIPWPSIWQVREQYWISELRRQGCNLTNKHPGGNGGQSHTHEEEVHLPPNIDSHLIRIWGRIAHRSEYARKLRAKYRAQQSQKK